MLGVHKNNLVATLCIKRLQTKPDVNTSTVSYLKFKQADGNTHITWSTDAIQHPVISFEVGLSWRQDYNVLQVSPCQTRAKKQRFFQVLFVR